MRGTEVHKFFAAALAQERLLQAQVAASIGNDFVLNLAVETLFDFATCRSQCRGGDHIIENLLGRIVNQAIGGIMLDAGGLHDEALGMVRSIGEAANLLALFRVKPISYKKWATASEIERRRDFSPVKVRIVIEEANLIPIPMDKNAYDRMCDKYIHVNPSTSPNSHNKDGIRNVGGNVQFLGSVDFHQELSYTVMQAAMLAASILNRPEQLKELTQLLNKRKN